MLWFVQILPEFFVVTRLLRQVPPLLLWSVTALALAIRIKTGVPPLNNFLGHHAFLAGHFGAHWIFAGAERAAQHRAITFVLFVAWCFVNQWAVSSGATLMPGGNLLFGLLGIAAVSSLSSLLSPLQAFGWLRYAGSNSIVIYLGFFITLTLLLHIVSIQGLRMDPNLLATLAVVLGAGAPVLLFLLVRRTALRFLFVRPARANLVRPRIQQVRVGMAEARKS